MENTNYLIIGGGLAGGYAAAAIRKKDADGRVVIVTEEPHIPYDRVPLSKGYLMDKVEKDRLFFRKRDYYDKNRIELWEGRRVNVLESKDKRVKLDDGRELSFGKLLLATGGKPKKVPLAGIDLQGVYFLRTLEDCEAIKRAIGEAQRAVVIGGGFIGCELAAAFSMKGLQTTIVEMGPYLLNMAIDEETGDWIGTYFSKKGVDVMCNATASELVGDGGRVVALRLKDGRRLDADLVVVGVGISINTGLAEQSGLKVDRGIVTDEYLETSAESVYAAGDVARFYSPPFKRHLRVEHYDVAVKHGTIAGSNMAGGERRAFDELPYFFSYQFDLKINAFGDLSQKTKIVRRGRLDEKEGFFQFYFNGNTLDAILSVNRPWEEVKRTKEYVVRRKVLDRPVDISDESKKLEEIFR